MFVGIPVEKLFEFAVRSSPQDERGKALRSGAGGSGEAASTTKPGEPPPPSTSTTTTSSSSLASTAQQPQHANHFTSLDQENPLHNMFFRPQVDPSLPYVPAPASSPFLSSSLASSRSQQADTLLAASSPAATNTTAAKSGAEQPPSSKPLTDFQETLVSCLGEYMQNEELPVPEKRDRVAFLLGLLAQSDDLSSTSSSSAPSPPSSSPPAISSCTSAVPSPPSSSSFSSPTSSPPQLLQPRRQESRKRRSPSPTPPLSSQMTHTSIHETGTTPHPPSQDHSSSLHPQQAQAPCYHPQQHSIRDSYDYPSLQLHHQASLQQKEEGVILKERFTPQEGGEAEERQDGRESNSEIEESYFNVQRQPIYEPASRGDQQITPRGERYYSHYNGKEHEEQEEEVEGGCHKRSRMEASNDALMLGLTRSRGGHSFHHQHRRHRPHVTSPRWPSHLAQQCISFLQSTGPPQLWNDDSHLHFFSQCWHYRDFYFKRLFYYTSMDPAAADQGNLRFALTTHLEDHTLQDVPLVLSAYVMLALAASTLGHDVTAKHFWMKAQYMITKLDPHCEDYSVAETLTSIVQYYFAEEGIPGSTQTLWMVEMAMRICRKNTTSLHTPAYLRCLILKILLSLNGQVSLEQLEQVYVEWKDVQQYPLYLTASHEAMLPIPTSTWKAALNASSIAFHSLCAILIKKLRKGPSPAGPAPDSDLMELLGVLASTEERLVRMKHQFPPELYLFLQLTTLANKVQCFKEIGLFQQALQCARAYHHVSRPRRHSSLYIGTAMLLTDQVVADLLLERDDVALLTQHMETMRVSSQSIKSFTPLRESYEKALAERHRSVNISSPVFSFTASSPSLSCSPVNQQQQQRQHYRPLPVQNESSNTPLFFPRNHRLRLESTATITPTLEQQQVLQEEQEQQRQQRQRQRQHQQQKEEEEEKEQQQTSPQPVSFGAPPVYNFLPPRHRHRLPSQPSHQHQYPDQHNHLHHHLPQNPSHPPSHSYPPESTSTASYRHHAKDVPLNHQYQNLHSHYPGQHQSTSSYYQPPLPQLPPSRHHVEDNNDNKKVEYNSRITHPQLPSPSPSSATASSSPMAPPAALPSSSSSAASPSSPTTSASASSSSSSSAANFAEEVAMVAPELLSSTKFGANSPSSATHSSSFSFLDTDLFFA
ncbi:hypothetical protein QOT17_011558 [Balamuthia mandrillaris]